MMKRKHCVLHALGENLAKFEAHFGPINLGGANDPAHHRRHELARRTEDAAKVGAVAEAGHDRAAVIEVRTQGTVGH